jgi:beta-galactosidase/beta-glucuronidase
MNEIPRPEHPKPQFERTSWINLNGKWTYTFDFGESGLSFGKKLNESKGFNDQILVPFCPESELSGVAHTDFINAMWYHREIEVPKDWEDKRVILHFGGVDYESEVFINGISVGTHFGGTISFNFDISNHIIAGSSYDLVVRVKDHTRDGHQPRGKQSRNYASSGCSYTRTTGIWQTVWLEAMTKVGLKDVHIVPDYDSSSFSFTPRFFELESGNQFKISVLNGRELVAEKTVLANNGVPSIVAIPNVESWSPENPFLYDIEFNVLNPDGSVVDSVKSYAGMRKMHIEGNRVFLNNKPLYQRLVLDQGFYPDGIWTAPNDNAFKNDIELSMKAGFNGARLHQKVFEERFHYWADKLGYLTWGESASWGCDCNSELSARNFIAEWREIILRDRNHPSIITWTPFNETGDYSNPQQHERLHIDCYHLSRNLDPTRPVNDASGWIHHITDLWTVHSYIQDAKGLTKKLTPTAEEGVMRNYPKKEPAYTGQPYLLDEYGGIKWIPAKDKAFAENSWGYGDAPKTLEEFYERLETLTDAILDQKHMMGYCYTQLTDVEQEQNGIYNYDRSEKFDMEKISKVFSKMPEWFE